MRLTTATACAAVVMLTSTALSASGSASSRNQDTPLTIVLKFNIDRALVADDFSIARAMAEANRLWRPYGVALVGSSRDLTDPSLDVDIEDLPLARNPRAAMMTPLGAIDFSVDGSPDRRIRISLRSIIDLVTPSWSQRPPLWREIVLSRAVGRVLAHEVGHFVLRFPAHVPTGLMAANHTADEFADREASRFALTPLLEFRLRQFVNEARRRRMM
jgi:hypothetical protein